MTQIACDNKVVTLINTFKVLPENQQRLVKILVEATEEVMRHIPGFVSANIHKSLDGQSVANYAQWETKEAFETMLSNPLAISHMKVAAELAISYEPFLYDVVHVDVKNLKI